MACRLYWAVSRLEPGDCTVTGLDYPMWAGLTPGSNEGSVPVGNTAEPDRRRQATLHLYARRK